MSTFQLCCWNSTCQEQRLSGTATLQDIHVQLSPLQLEQQLSGTATLWQKYGIVSALHVLPVAVCLHL